MKALERIIESAKMAVHAPVDNIGLQMSDTNTFIENINVSVQINRIEEFMNEGNVLKAYQTLFSIIDWLEEKKIPNNPKTIERKAKGIAVAWHANGQKLRERKFTSGKMHGVQVGWFDNGNRKYYCMYKDGAVDGVQKYWYPNGQQASDTVYINGILEGVHRSWSQDGSLEFEAVYINGDLVG